MSILRRILLLSLLLFVSISTFGQVSVIDTIDFGSNVVWGNGVNPQTNKIYVGVRCGGEHSDDSVFVLDGLSHSIIKAIRAGNFPEYIGINPKTNRIYVPNGDYNNISVIDGATDSVVDSIVVGSYPWGVGVNPKTNKIYVANGDNVSVIDGTGDSVIAIVGVGNYAQGVCVDSLTNRIYVTNWHSDSVYVIDGLKDSVIAKIEVGAYPGAVCVNSKTNRVYVSNEGATSHDGTISVVDATVDSVIATIDISDNPRKIDVNPGNNHIYVGTFWDSFIVIDGVSNSVIDNFDLAGHATVTGFSFNPQTNRIYVGRHDAGLLLVLEDTGVDTLITVTSPNGGEDWKVDSTYDITWNSDGTSGNVRIEYSTNNGGSWIEEITSTPDDGSYSWVIPDNPSDSCLVRISDTVGNPSDVSDSMFTIFSGSGIEDKQVLREEVSVLSFHSGIKIRYSLPKKEKVRVEIYNVLGQRKKKLLDEIKLSGRYTLNWEGKNGIYFVRVEIGDRVYKEKAIIVR